MAKNPKRGRPRATRTLPTATSLRLPPDLSDALERRLETARREAGPGATITRTRLILDLLRASLAA